MTAYVLGEPLIGFIRMLGVPKAFENTLSPLWTLSFPTLMSTEHALMIGFLLGTLFKYVFKEKGQKLSHFLYQGSYLFLNRFFIPLMPLFILGFTLKLQHEGLLNFIVEDYFRIFLIISSLLLAYNVFIFFNLAKFSVRELKEYLTHVLPAALTGFSTMSSAASLPLTLKAAHHNTQEKEVTTAIAASTVNNHLVGDCFAIPIMALALLCAFQMPLPDLSTYLTFAFFFVMAKFAVAAVPGGGILVMLPILKTYLGFTPDMLSLITLLYFLFDPVITFMNVLGNGAFTILFQRIHKLITKHK
jgi:Na+/H+-dicarboxylate symporter